MPAVVFLKYVGWQIVLALVLCLAGFGLGGPSGALSTALGSLIATLPNLYFTLQAFRFKAEVDPVRALGALFRGEAGKFILVGVLCALVFRFINVSAPLLLFTSLFVMLVAQPIISVFVFPSLRDAKKARKEID